MAESTFEVIDGFIIDTETGEVIGDNEQPELLDNEISVLRVLSRIQDAESRIIELENNAELVKARAIVEKHKKIVKRAENRRDWLLARYIPEIAAFAKHMLKGKSKTWDTIYGSVSFRKTNAKIAVRDHEAAIKWAEKALSDAQIVCEEAIHTERSLLVKKLPETILEQLSAQSTPEILNAFIITPEGESVKINTGVSQEEHRQE